MGYHLSNTCTKFTKTSARHRSWAPEPQPLSILGSWMWPEQLLEVFRNTLSSLNKTYYDISSCIRVLTLLFVKTSPSAPLQRTPRCRSLTFMWKVAHIVTLSSAPLAAGQYVAPGGSALISPWDTYDTSESKSCNPAEKSRFFSGVHALTCSHAWVTGIDQRCGWSHALI